MELSGEKVSLTKISVNELDFICKIECDKSIWYFEEYVQSNENEVRKEYLHKIEEKERIRNYDFIVTIVEGVSKIPIGLAQIWSYSEFRKSWELGFAILPEYSGKGYGRESAKLLLAFAFEQLDAHKVVGMCHSKNTRSVSLMEDIGMTREAIFKEELFWHNKWIDQYFFSILEKEYLLKYKQ